MSDPRQEVLEAVWDQVVQLFAEKQMHHPSRARLEFDSGMHDSCRHFAGCMLDGSCVVASPELADMPFGTTLAVLSHEAGHVEDLRSPGIWWFRGGKLKRVDALPSKGAGKIIRAWGERDNDEVERVADALGEIALGDRIGYVGHPGCLVQHVGAGRKRPKNLK